MRVVESRSSSSDIRLWPWFYTLQGFAFIEPWNVLHAKIKRCLVLIMDNQNSSLFDSTKGQYDAIFRASRIFDMYDRSSFLSESLLEGFDAFEGLSYLNQTGTRLITTAKFGANITNHFEARYVLNMRENVRFREEPLSDGWTSFVTGNPPPTEISVEWLESLQSSASDDAAPLMFGEWFLADDQPEIEPIGLALEWKNIIREPVIPYDLTERREKLAHAYQILAPYLENMEVEE